MTSYWNSRWRPSLPVSMAANLNFGCRPKSDSVDRVISESGMARNMGDVSWNRGAISHRSKVISTFILVVAILYSGNQSTSGNVGSVRAVSGNCRKCRGSRWNRVASLLRSIIISTSGFRGRLVENGGVEAEIASLSQAFRKLLPLPFFRPPSWISGGRRRIF